MNDMNQVSGSFSISPHIDQILKKGSHHTLRSPDYIMNHSRTILQILPATGWHAAFKQAGPANAAQEVICWALVQEDGGGQKLVGMAVNLSGSEVQFVDEMSGFDGYFCT